jgi:hypothetical protein
MEELADKTVGKWDNFRIKIVTLQGCATTKHVSDRIMPVSKGMKNTEMYLRSNRAQMGVITEDACQNPLQVLDMWDSQARIVQQTVLPNSAA